ncbi:hypothetical protein EBT31_11225 [bacterium]|jgi:hypothetical protein|nr:hypothetical protein [bacterium]NBX49346.1 hypothetical protein [bacterium]
MTAINMNEFSSPKEYTDFLQAKLDHYNKWLMNPKRELGTTYPGYPGDSKLVKKGKKMSEVTVNEVKTETAVKGKRAKREGATKQVRAIELYKQLGGDKGAVIDAFMSQLSMSKAGATTYFYNAKKASK